MKTLLIDMPVHGATLEKLRVLNGIQIEIVEPAGSARELPSTLLAKTNFLFCSVPPSNLDAAQNVEWIQISSVGFSQLYGLDLPQKNIRVCNARGVFDPTIAE